MIQTYSMHTDLSNTHKHGSAMQRISRYLNKIIMK